MASSPGGEGYFAALRRLLTGLLSIGRTRLELLSVEVQEAKLHFVRLLVYALSAVFFLGLAIVAAMAGMTLAFWEQRISVLAGFAAAFLLFAGILVALAARAFRRNASLFRSTLAELEADLALLKGKEP